MKINWVPFFIILPLLSGCDSNVLPSRAVEVDLGNSIDSPQQVAEYIVDYLETKGFVLEDANGFDKLTSQTTGFDLRSKEDIDVSIGIHKPKQVFVRISEFGECWSQKGDAVFKGLVLFLKNRSHELDISKEPRRDCPGNEPLGTH